MFLKLDFNIWCFFMHLILLHFQKRYKLLNVNDLCFTHCSWKTQGLKITRGGSAWCLLPISDTANQHTFKHRKTEGSTMLLTWIPTFVSSFSSQGKVYQTLTALNYWKYHWITTLLNNNMKLNELRFYTAFKQYFDFWINILKCWFSWIYI